VHGPSGLDTLHRGYLWNENEKTWELNFADTIIRDENGNCIEYKMTHWNNDHSALVLYRRFLAEYDANNQILDLRFYGESSQVNDLNTYIEYKYVYDSYGNNIYSTYDEIKNNIPIESWKTYSYFSPLEISTDASLWDVTFEGSHPEANNQWCLQ